MATQLRLTYPWYRDRPFIKMVAITVASSFAALFTLFEIPAWFHLYTPPADLSILVVFYAVAAILITLVRVIIVLAGNLAESRNLAGELVGNEDSILSMMKDAESNSRWGEIIKLGNALSEFLWYTSRKKLRVEIGHFVEVAARQSNDTETLARTLIEDLGNTIMTLGDVNQGLTYIKQGINVAEASGHDYLVFRGYRNLANCYSFKKETPNATAALIAAQAAADRLPDERQRIEALGALEYSRCKVFESTGDYAQAIAALDAAVLHYADLRDRYPSTARSNHDRMVKVYREKAVVYLKMNTETARDLAYEACQTGLNLAQAAQNYENIVRCSCIMAKLLLDKDAVPAAEGVMNIAAKNIAKVDQPALLDEFNRVNRRIVNARHSDNAAS